MNIARLYFSSKRDISAACTHTPRAFCFQCTLSPSIDMVAGTGGETAKHEILLSNIGFIILN